MPDAVREIALTKILADLKVTRVHCGVLLHCDRLWYDHVVFINVQGMGSDIELGKT